MKAKGRVQGVLGLYCLHMRGLKLLWGLSSPHWHHAVRGEQRYQGAHGNYSAGGDPVLYRGHAIRHLLDNLSLCLHLAVATMYKPLFGSF